MLLAEQILRLFLLCVRLPCLCKKHYALCKTLSATNVMCKCWISSGCVNKSTSTAILLKKCFLRKTMFRKSNFFVIPNVALQRTFKNKSSQDLFLLLDTSVSCKDPVLTLLHCHEPWRLLSLFAVLHLRAFTCPYPGISLRIVKAWHVESAGSCRKWQFHKRSSFAGLDWAEGDTNTIVAISLPQPHQVFLFMRVNHFESSSIILKWFWGFFKYFTAFHQSKVHAQSHRVVSVSLSFGLLALKSWTSHRLDEEKSETTSATSRATRNLNDLRHATEKRRPQDHRCVSGQWLLQRPLPLSVFASLFQFQSQKM